MTGKKRSSKNDANKQAALDVEAVEARLKQLRQKQRELLKNSGKSVREFRHEVALLKKAGVVSARTNAAKQEPTKYMRAKVRKFYDVIAGIKIPVRAPKVIREDYASKGIFEQRGAFIMVPKDTPYTKATLDKKKRVKISEPLASRTVTRSAVTINKIVLPFNAANLLDLANRLEKEPSIPNELDGVNQYAFTLFGHRSLLAFPTKQELVEYIKVRYVHLFSGRRGRQGVKHFSLITYSGGSSIIPDTAEPKFYSQRGQGRKPNATGRNDRNSWYDNRKREVKAAKEKKRRAKLNEDEKAIYREKAKARAKASYDNRKGK